MNTTQLGYIKDVKELLTSLVIYRDGLAILKGLSGPETVRVNKNIIKVFKDCELKITIKANLHLVNFLDITLNLRNNTDKPYRKPNSHPVYINKKL